MTKERKIVDLTGMVFGRLTVLGLDRREKATRGTRIYWKCLCSCGKEITTRGENLKNGSTKSCGCYNKDRVHEIQFDDLTGKRFGFWTVLKVDKVVKEPGATRYFWLCECDCGTIKSVGAGSLRGGKSKSCGCYKKTVSAKLNRREFGVASFNKVFSRYKQSAKERKVSFDLSKDEFFEFTQEKCYYCGREPGTLSKNMFKNGDFLYNGLDRIDSSLGYIKENIVTCCTLCNFAKRSTPQKEFIEWIEKVYFNLFSKKLRESI
jgi:hypothetical protein